MSLLQLLQEASSLSLSDAKKALSKDKIGKVIFKKDLQLSDIENAESFMSTIKFHVLNNDNVKNFVVSRHNVKDIDTVQLGKLRALRGKDLTKEKLDELQEFINFVFKEHASVERGTMSNALRRELETWINTSGVHHHLAPWAIKELKSIPYIRPKKKILVYRGVLFSEHSLKVDRNHYDGSLSEGNGLKFLKSVREGSRTVDLDWTRPSSWTVSREVAERFAQNGPASSNAMATLKWLSRGPKKIDGALGYVISTLADPEDILLDTSRVHIKSQFSGEGEVILQPGKYLSRIVKKYTAVDGEVDPDVKEDNPTTELVAKAIEDSKAFAESISIADDLKEITYYPIYDLRDLFRHGDEAISKIRILVTDANTTIIMHEYERVQKFLKEKLSHLEPTDFRADNLLSMPELGPQAARMTSLMKMAKEKVSHKDHVSDKNPKGHVQAHELSANDFRATISSYNTKQLQKDLLVNTLIKDKSTEEILNKMHYATDGSPPARITALGAVKQKALVSSILSKFIAKLGLDPSDDPQANSKTAINLLMKAYRNAVILSRTANMKNYMLEEKVEKYEDN